MAQADSLKNVLSTDQSVKPTPVEVWANCSVQASGQERVLARNK